MDTRTFLQRDKGKLPFAQTFRTVNNITERASVAGTIVIDRAPVPIRGPDPSMVMGTMMGTSIRVQGECVVRIAGLGGKVEAIIVQNLKNAYGKLPDIVGEWVATREARVAATRPEVGFAGRLVPRPSIALGNLDAMDDVSSADVSSQETSPRLISASSGVAESEDGSDGSAASFHSADSFVHARETFGESWGEAQGAGAAADDSGTSPRLSTPSFAANRSRPPLPLSPRGAETHDAETTRTPAASGLTPHAFESDSPLETPEFFRRASNGPSNAREGEPRAAAAKRERHRRRAAAGRRGGRGWRGVTGTSTARTSARGGRRGGRGTAANALRRRRASGVRTPSRRFRGAAHERKRHKQRRVPERRRAVVLLRARAAGLALAGRRRRRRESAGERRGPPHRARRRPVRWTRRRSRGAPRTTRTCARPSRRGPRRRDARGGDFVFYLHRVRRRAYGGTETRRL